MPDATSIFCASLFRDACFEFRVLAACCRWPPESNRATLSALLEEQPTDWQALLRLSERHRVAGLVAASLASRPEVPAPVAKHLADRGQQILRENALHTAVAARTIKALGERCVPCVVLKGAPLANNVYGSLSVRHAKDIDLLIAPEQLEAAEGSLLEQGFEAAPEHPNLSQQQAERWARHRKHYEFVHRPTGCQLELHWKSYYNSLTDGGSTVQSVPVQVGSGVTLPSLPLDELFLYLCVHGSGHAWFRLKWLIDIATIQRAVSQAERDTFLRLARERGLEKPVEQALLLCMGLYPELELPLPQGLTRSGKWLAKVGRDALTPQADGSAGKEFQMSGTRAASRFLLRSGWRYRIEEAKVLAAWPVDSGSRRHADLPLLVDRLVQVPVLGRMVLWLWQRWRRVTHRA